MVRICMAFGVLALAGSWWDRIPILSVFGVAVTGSESPPPNEPKELARYDAKIKPADRQHWSYLPVKKPAIPTVKNAAWVRNPIDAFVLNRLERKGWKPS